MNYLDVHYELIYGLMAGIEIVPQEKLMEGDDFVIIFDIFFLRFIIVKGHY